MHRTDFRPLFLAVSLACAGWWQPTTVLAQPTLHVYTDGTLNPLRDLDLASPLGEAISPVGDYLYVANNFGDTVSVLSLSTNGLSVQPRAKIALSSSCFPVDIEIGGKDNRLYVACFGPGIGDFRSVEGHVETYAKGISGYYELFKERIEFDPDPGATDTRPFTSITDMLPRPDGKYLYVTGFQNELCLGIIPIDFGVVWIVDTTTHQVVDTYPPGSDLCSRLVDEYYVEPVNLALSPDGGTLYASINGSDPPIVLEMPLASGGGRFNDVAIKSIDLGSNSADKDPAGLYITDDGSTLFVTHNGLNEVARFRISVVDLVTRSVVKRIDLPGISDPNFIDYNPTSLVPIAGGWLLVPLFGNDNNAGNTVAMISISLRELVGFIQIPQSSTQTGGTIQDNGPVSVVVNPGTNIAYVLNHLPDNIAVLDLPPMSSGLSPLVFLLGFGMLTLLVHRRRWKRMQR